MWAMRWCAWAPEPGASWLNELADPGGGRGRWGEHIALRDGELIIEQVSAGHCRRHHFSPWRTRIAMPQGPRQLIHINDTGAGGAQVDVGVYATPERRRQVAQELLALLPPPLSPPAPP